MVLLLGAHGLFIAGMQPLAAIILTALGSAGDVHPFVGLGGQLLGRGHHVTILSNPLFEPLIRQSGLDFEPIGTAAQFDAVRRDPNLWHPLRAFGTVARFGIVATMRPVFDAIAARVSDGDLIVGAHSLDFGARIAQERLGVPVVTIHLAPAVFRSAELPPVLLPGLASVRLPRWATRLSYRLADALLCDRLLAPPVNALRHELGLPPVRRLLDKWWFSPDRVVGLFPEWYAPIQSDWPPQTVLTGFPLWDQGQSAELRPEVRQWLEQGERPVVFTPGSAMLYGHAFFQAAADACQQLGRRGLLLTRFPEQLPKRLPDGVRHFDYVPFSQLLPHAAALVHHGGIGSSSQGLAAGVPQLVMPMAHDQHDNAARLARLGVAQSLRPRAFRGPAVARALKRLLNSDQVAICCRQAANRLTADGDALQRACDVIERRA